MSKNNNNTSAAAFWGAFFGSLVGALANRWIDENPESFKKLCEKAGINPKDKKPLEQMSVPELKKLLEETEKEENFEFAIKLRDLIEKKTKQALGSAEEQIIKKSKPK